MTGPRVVALTEYPPADDPEIDVARWARPYVWRAPASFPRRGWLYGGHYVRGYVSTTLAPSGLGKSALALGEAVALASGKPILGHRPAGRCRVWYWNGEDPFEETERRLSAILKHNELDREDVEGWLFIGSGREAELIIGKQARDGAEIQAPVVEAVERLLVGLRIDVAMIDPFVSSHRVSENDNGQIDQVTKAWSRVAGHCKVAVELVHHCRKRSAVGSETVVEDGRGAVALIATVRSARVLNAMTAPEAERAGVDFHGPFFRVDIGKANLTPAETASTWYRFESVELGNGCGPERGDSVGVVVPWAWPHHLEGVTPAQLNDVQDAIDAGEWRESIQSMRWAGRAVADVLGLNADNLRDRARIKAHLKRWLRDGALRRATMRDGKSVDRPTIVTGERVQP